MTRDVGRIALIASVSEILEQTESAGVETSANAPVQVSTRYELVLIGIAAIVFLACIISPPALMDDVDAVHGQMARNMVQSGDWVIPHLDGVAYMEKAPLPYWLIAICYLILGVHDWVARIPTALSAICISFLAFQRALDEDGEDARSLRWSTLMAVALAVGVLLKGLIALVVPVGGVFVYLTLTRQLSSRRTWRQLHPFSSLLIFLLI